MDQPGKGLGGNEQAELGRPPRPPVLAAEPEFLAHGRPRPGKCRSLKKPRSHQCPVSDSCSRRSDCCLEMGAGDVRPGPPHVPPGLSPVPAVTRGSHRTAPRGAHTARVPRGRATTAAPKFRNFFHPAWPSRPPTQTGVERPGRGGPPGTVQREAGGHLSAPFAPAGQPAADPSAARSRPLAAEAPGSGWGRGGRGAQAHSPRPASFARGPRHAPRARSTWPGAAKYAPDPGDPGPAGCARLRRARELRAGLSGPPAAPPPRGPRCASLQLCIWRAKSRGRPPRSPRGFFSPAVGDRRGRAPWGDLLPLAEKHLGEKRTWAPAQERTDRPPQTSSQAGPRGGRREPLRQGRSQALLRRGSRPWGKTRGDARSTEVKETPR